MNIDYPAWLETKELDPGSGAYEQLDPALRARLKSQIALLHEIWLPQKAEGGVFRSVGAAGSYVEQYKALDWALFALDVAYASPMGFIAALLPSLMAGVPNIIICRLGAASAPLEQGISAAMELLGREEIFALTANELHNLAEELFAQSPHGRLLALGHELAGAYCLPGVVKIGLDAAEPDQDALAWQHPGLALEAVRPEERYNAVISARPGHGTQYKAPLVLGQDYDYFWQWPELDPAFFRRKTVLVTQKHG